MIFKRNKLIWKCLHRECVVETSNVAILNSIVLIQFWVFNCCSWIIMLFYFNFRGIMIIRQLMHSWKNNSKQLFTVHPAPPAQKRDEVFFSRVFACQMSVYRKPENVMVIHIQYRKRRPTDSSHFAALFFLLFCHCLNKIDTKLFGALCAVCTIHTIRW